MGSPSLVSIGDWPHRLVGRWRIPRQCPGITCDIGGEYGEGAFRIGGKTVDYYSTAGASIGFKLGSQSKAVFLLLLEKKALSEFRQPKGWEIGVDGSVALVKAGAGRAIGTTNIKNPIVGFIMTNKSLMYNLTLEGSKFTKLHK